MMTNGTPLVTFACPCVRCGYDLMGLDISGRCPECGTRVRRSYSGGRLEDADGAWLRTVSRGLTLVARACALGLAGVTLAIVLIVGLLAALRLGALDGWRTPAAIASVAAGAPLLASFGMLLSGAWLATAREPGAPACAQRAVCRRLAAAALAIGVVAAGAGLLAPLSLARTPALMTAVDALLILGIAVLCLLAAVGALHLARIAIRLPDAPLGARLVRRSRVAVALVTLCGLAVTPYVLDPTLDYLTLPGSLYAGLYGLLVVVTLAAIGAFARQAQSLARAVRAVTAKDEA